MKIIFMGTPDFAVPSLEQLLASVHQVVAVVTAPDKPRGRGQRVSATPIKILAEKHRIPILQPTSPKDPDFPNALRIFGADLFVVVAFRILPPSIFTIPKKGTFNLHASLLPKYRGAAPIQWAIINGETETGVTTFFIQEKVDTGNVLLQRAIPISPDMTTGDLHDTLAELGAKTVLETVELLDAGEVQTTKQLDSMATPAPKIFRATCRIDWAKSAREVHNLIRGLSPHPTAWTMHADRQIKVFRSKIVDSTIHTKPGQILQADNELIISCGSGTIAVITLQQEGKKAMDADEFLRGFRLRVHDCFY